MVPLGPRATLAAMACSGASSPAALCSGILASAGMPAVPVPRAPVDIRTPVQVRQFVPDPYRRTARSYCIRIALVDGLQKIVWW